MNTENINASFGPGEADPMRGPTGRTALLPCPFCGSRLLSFTHDGTATIVLCGDCCGMGPLGMDEETATIAWDMRALAAAPSASADKAEPVAWKQITRTGYVRGLQVEPPSSYQREAADIEGDEFVPLYAPTATTPPAPPTALLREAMEARRIVCAAIRADDGSLLMGIRHYSADMHAQIARMGPGGTRFMHRHDPDQGFVDQHGVYLTREEAYPIAKAAGQIVRPDACRGETLYSEGLY